VGLRQMRQCWWKRRGWSNCISHVDAGGRGRGGGGVAPTTSIAVGMVFTEPRGAHRPCSTCREERARASMRQQRSGTGWVGDNR